MKPVTRIRDLSEIFELDLLMVTEFLPLDDKMKLVDTFPPVIGQIDIFRFYHDILSRGRQVQLFNKLYNVKTIKITSLSSSILIRLIWIQNLV